MSGSNYKISYCQILESERRLQLSNLLEFLYIKQQSDNISLKDIVKYGDNGAFVRFRNGKFLKRFTLPWLIAYYQRRLETLIHSLLGGIIANFKNSVHNSCILLDKL